MDACYDVIEVEFKVKGESRVLVAQAACQGNLQQSLGPDHVHCPVNQRVTLLDKSATHGVSVLSHPILQIKYQTKSRGELLGHFGP